MGILHMSLPAMTLGAHGVRPLSPVRAGMLFGWELVLSFILVSVVYAVAIGEPSFGNIAPFAVGLSLVVDLFAGAQCAVNAFDCSIVPHGHDTLTSPLAISWSRHNDRQTPVDCGLD
jgi:hypothetical protein